MNILSLAFLVETMFHIIQYSHIQISY